MTGSRKRKSEAGSPLILIAPSDERRGEEFGDQSISLADTYQRAVVAAGGVPVILSYMADPRVIAESVRRCDGVLLTGGDDINPQLYMRRVPRHLAKTVKPALWERDLRELMVIKELFRQRKPVFGVCRGHQLLNVALGGTLVVDIARQMPDAINHSRDDRKNEIVHQARLTGGSLLAKITGKQHLEVNSTHHQAVGRVAGPLFVTARSPDGVVEATELRPEASGLAPFLLSVQFHPERLAARRPEHQALFAGFIRACMKNRKSNV
jgi:putative glutamine amidotransferase